MTVSLAPQLISEQAAERSARRVTTLELEKRKKKEERRVLASTEVKEPAVIRKKQRIMSWVMESKIIHEAVSVAQGLATDLVLPSKIDQR